MKRFFRIIWAFLRHPIRVTRFSFANWNTKYRCIDCQPPYIIPGRGKRAKQRAEDHAKIHAAKRNRRGQRALRKGRAVSMRQGFAPAERGKRR